MKRILLALAVTSVLVLPSHSDDDSLSAEELAHHMGVASWVSKIRVQGSGLNLQVCHVVNGKVIDTILGDGAPPLLDREFRRVAILASHIQGSTQLSIQILGGFIVKRQTVYIPLDVHARLPPTISEGDYVLGGDISLEAINKDRPVSTIQDIKNGLLLRVTQRSQ